MLEIQVRITDSGRSLPFGAFVDLMVAEIVRGLGVEIQKVANAEMHAASMGSPLKASEEEHRRTRPLAVSVNEAANMLGLSSATIRRHIAQRRLGAVRFGKRVLVPMEALEKVMLEGVARR